MLAKEIKTRVVSIELTIRESVELYHALTSHSKIGDVEENILDELGQILTSGDLKQ